MLVPNLRAVKPTAFYREERTRFFGRERVAHEVSRNGINIKRMPLNMHVSSAELVEVYIDNLRQFTGYKIINDEVVFDDYVDGYVHIIIDMTLVDKGLKWLKLQFNELIDHTDTAETTYTTDRRPGLPHIKTKVRPVVMVQPRIGFCRPDTQHDALLYCPYFGMYGRDAITYALVTDGGQMSEFRCINIRVRDPNYIPPVRGRVLVDRTGSYMIDGNFHTVETETGLYASFDPSYGHIDIEPPNLFAVDEEQYVYLLLQLKDEESTWWDIFEFYDEDEWTLTVDGIPQDDWNMVSAIVETGFVGDLIRFKLDRFKDTDITISLVCMDNELFTGTIKAKGILTDAVTQVPQLEWTVKEFIAPEEPDPENPVEPDPEAPEPEEPKESEYTYTGEINESGVFLVVTHSEFGGLFTFNLNGQLIIESERVHPGTSSTLSVSHDIDFVEEYGPQTPTVIMYDEQYLLWESNNPFSQMYLTLPTRFTIDNTYYFAPEPTQLLNFRLVLEGDEYVGQYETVPRNAIKEVTNPFTDHEQIKFIRVENSYPYYGTEEPLPPEAVMTLTAGATIEVSAPGFTAQTFEVSATIDIEPDPDPELPEEPEA